jgi:serine/threonine protein kinase
MSMPPKYTRKIYFASQEEQIKWVKIMKKTSQSQEFKEYYEVGKVLGAGSMGEVKMCKHKKTGTSCAVKIIKKANKSEKELELQRREIEALQFC